MKMREELFDYTCMQNLNLPADNLDYVFRTPPEDFQGLLVFSAAAPVKKRAWWVELEFSLQQCLSVRAARIGSLVIFTRTLAPWLPVLLFVRVSTFLKNHHMDTLTRSNTRFSSAGK